MGWRLAKTLEQLRKEINAAHPGRDQRSDGAVADDNHPTTSDHHPRNKNHPGVVTAIDVDEHAADGGQTVGRWLWDQLLASRDPRIKYVIYEEQMFSAYPTSTHPAWTPRSGKGHTQHVHVSAADDPVLYDNNKPWFTTKEADVTAEELRQIVGEEVAKGVAHLERRIANVHLAARDPILSELLAHARATNTHGTETAITAANVADELARRLAE